MTSPWGTTVITQVSSAAPSADPVWVDIGTWVRPGTSCSLGRQSALPGTDPGTFEIVLTNNDRRWTVGNPSSPVFPWWKPGRRIRQYEIIPTSPPTTVELFDGYITLEGIQESIDIDTTDGTDVTVAVVRVSATDLIGRAQSARTFISTLGAHILGSGPAQYLRGYYPMNDPAAPFTDVTANGGAIMVSKPGKAAWFTPPDTALEIDVSPGGAQGPPGEDVDFAAWTPYCDVPSANLYDSARGLATVSIAADDGPVIAFACWCRKRDLFHNQPRLYSTSGLWDMYFSDGVTTGSGVIDDNGASTSATPTLPIPYPLDVWRLRTLTINATTGAASLWVGSDLVATATLTSAPADINFDRLTAGFELHGSVAHIQIYLGADPFSYEEHLAQFAVGMAGLAGQYTGERVATIARYAGIPFDPLNLDKGTVPMSKATLAGSRAADEWSRARETEQGRLFVDGSGRLIFHDRRHVLNV